MNAITKVPVGVNFRAKAEIIDLERLGWDFYEIYMDIYLCHQDNYRQENGLPKKSFDMDFTVEDAAEWEREHHCVEIIVNADGTTKNGMCQKPEFGNDTYEKDDTGDDEKTVEDLNTLLEKGLLWDIEIDF